MCEILGRQQGIHLSCNDKCFAVNFFESRKVFVLGVYGSIMLFDLIFVEFFIH